MIAVLIYRISNESSSAFIQGRDAVYAAIGEGLIDPLDWLSTEVTHNEESDYIDLVITYDDGRGGQ